jgi:cell division protein FtsI (penicillin-binding protein 3)
MIYGRFLLIVGIWVIWMGVISVQLVHLQVNQHQTLSKRALKQRRQQINDRQLRGTIYDSTGNQLAVSLDVESLFIEPDKILDVEATAAKLAPVLGEKVQSVANRIKKAKENGKTKHLRFAPKLDDEKVAKIKAYDLPGVVWEKDQKRTYPHKSAAAQVVGFSNMEDRGQSGIESSQEKNLQGDVIGGYSEHDRLGRVYEFSEDASTPAKDVYLTINSNIQYEAETALLEGIKNAGAKGGTAIVLDPKTGEVLAMASAPTFDLNRYKDSAPVAWKNKSIEEYYSPGSVFKLITYGAALDAGLISPNEEIDCNKGSIVVAGHRFTDGHPLGLAPLTKALAVSNNVAAIKIGQRLEKDRFYEYARRFGIGAETGIELPSETAGSFRSPKGWAGDSLASMSIGYEVTVTSLQMASAYATIANDGVRVQPHVVKQIGEAGKTPSYTAQPQRTQVISAEAARTLRNMMREVVTNGTGRRAQLEGYTVSGKTGTAWKFDPKKGFSEGKRVSSFIGMAPADNPAVVIAIMLDEPTVGGDRTGGTIAAPVFKAIAERVLPRLNILPDKNIHPDFIKAVEATKDDKEGTESPTGGTVGKKTDAVDAANAGNKKTGATTETGEKNKDKKTGDKRIEIEGRKPETKTKDEKTKPRNKT